MLRVMIDTQHEQLVTFSQACHVIPGRPHISQIYRWSLRGLRGMRLEWVQVGGRRFTSHEALQRFFNSLTEQRTGEAIPTSSGKARQAQVQRVIQELEEDGFEVGAQSPQG